MLFKVFYQENKNLSPRRENTRTMYLELPVETEKEGVIKIRDLINEKTNYQLELIDALSEEAAKYEKETTNFEITEL